MLLAAILVAALVALAATIPYVQRTRLAQPAQDATAPLPQSAKADRAPAALAAAQAEAKAVVAALNGAPLAAEKADGVPTFDIARIEPNGEAVIAGRSPPGTTVELLRNGEVLDSIVVDASGQFAMVPPKLPQGNYDLTLRAKQPDGKVTMSKQSVAVALDRTEKPVVALMTPDKPSVVLSKPAEDKPSAGKVTIDAVEVESAGKLHVSGKARAGTSLRFYLNDSFVAAVTADAEGRFAITVNEGVSPGNYRVRLDEVDPASGKVQARAEVPFSAPETVAGKPAASAQVASAGTGAAGAQPPTPQSSRLAAAGESAAQTSASAVVVPKIATTTVSRGDSLWRISQSTYGAGIRYAVIYKANAEQIRNPDLIYPGQVFVLPAK
jgi:nucleoid-associated protein YgaU